MYFCRFVCSFIGSFVVRMFLLFVDVIVCMEGGWMNGCERRITQ